MIIYITQNSFYFIHRNFIDFFSEKESKLVLVRETNKKPFYKIIEIARYFGIINTIKISQLEILWFFRLYFKIKKLNPEFVNDNNLNQFIKKIIHKEDVNKIISIGCPCKIKTAKIYKNSIEMINLHGGITPYQVGKFSPIKSLIRKHKYLGATIHKLSEEIDKGEIISQDYYQIKSKSRLKNYNYVIFLSKKLLSLYFKQKFLSIPQNLEAYFRHF